MDRTDDDIQIEFDQIVSEAVDRLDNGFYDDADFAVTCVCDGLQDEGLLSHDEEYSAEHVLDEHDMIFRVLS
jgi:hypothetical protein